MTITGWGAFWLFVSLFFLVDTGLFLKGYNTFWWEYRTPPEIAKQCEMLGIKYSKEMRKYYDFESSKNSDTSP